jgi:hypothetical protein
VPRWHAADAELRHRHPGQKIEPLRSAEPTAAGDTELEQLHPGLDEKTGETTPWLHELPVQRQAFRARLEERQGLMVPSDDPDWGDLGEAFPARSAPGRDAILRPPKPQITPSAAMLQLAAEHDTEPEAAD